MEINWKKEILFYYESRQNPNGDPGFENQPRLMPDGTIMVTDVRLKRTIRDYAKNKLGKNIFADYGKDGLPVTADTRAKEIVGKLEDDIIKDLLIKTFDVPLFGALVPVRKKSKKDQGEETTAAGTHFKITGPLQFGLGRSVNKVSVINPTISGVFVGDEKKEKTRTFGRFYSVEYALIKFFGVLNPANLGEYLSQKDVKENLKNAQEMLFECIWNGTNELITRSKFPQRSVFYLEIEYKDAIYNDLTYLVDENIKLKDKITELPAEPFKFDKLIRTVSERKDKINKIRLCGCAQIKDSVEKLAKDLEKELGSQINKVEVIKC